MRAGRAIVAVNRPQEHHVPILMDLTFGSPTVWLGLSAGLDRARPLPAGSPPVAAGSA